MKNIEEEKRGAEKEKLPKLLLVRLREEKEEPLLLRMTMIMRTIISQMKKTQKRVRIQKKKNLRQNQWMKLSHREGKENRKMSLRRKM